MSCNLYEDLIVEIFTRLPPKPLIRFRSLSKSLCSCISSPDFIRMHTFRSPQKFLFAHQAKNKEVFYTLHGEDELALLLCPKRGYIGITTKVPFPCGLIFNIVVGSFNGIFFLRSLKTKEYLVLWNPSIRRKLIVPNCLHLLENYVFDTGCGFDGIGFGFDPISDDYKIVWVCYVKDIAFVYALKTGAWCKIASPKPQFTGVTCDGHLFNGVLHWDVYHKYNESQDICYILTFNLSTHVFDMILSPVSTPDWVTTGLTTIQGSLALISRCRKLDNSWIWVWRDASWSVLFKLNTSKFYVLSALQLQPQLNNNGDLLLGIFHQGQQVNNPTTRVQSEVANFTADSDLVDCYECVESLQLLIMG